MYTWLVELGSGLTGVLSTVTMEQPYGRRIAAQLIRLRKYRRNRLFLSRVNLALSTFIQLQWFDYFHGSAVARSAAWRIHGSLSMSKYP